MRKTVQAEQAASGLLPPRPPAEVLAAGPQGEKAAREKSHGARQAGQGIGGDGEEAIGKQPGMN